MAQKQLVAVRIDAASLSRLKAFLPTLRKRSGENASVSGFVRASIEFALKNAEALLKEGV
jgi:hypothetical protein